MRSAMPRGASVQRATQSTKSRKGCLSGGQSRTAATDLRLSPPASRKRPDDARRMARPERHADELARLEREVGRGAVAVGGVHRDRDEDIHDALLTREKRIGGCDAVGRH